MGVCLIIGAGLPVAGVLHAWHHAIVTAFHRAAVDNPLTPEWTWALRRHLRRPCPTCSLLATLSTAHIHSPHQGGQGHGG